MWQEYKGAIIFILTYVVLYLALNTAYAFFVKSFLPGPDPATVGVTRQAAAIVRIFDPEVSARPADTNAYVPLVRGGATVVEVFEGCNGINVMVVYIAFLVAFRGPLWRFLLFAVAGVVIIYIINLLRVAGLYWVAVSFPQALYFFHKFLFTGVIYAAVFVGWYLWIKTVRQWKLQA